MTTGSSPERRQIVARSVTDCPPCSPTRHFLCLTVQYQHHCQIIARCNHIIKKIEGRMLWYCVADLRISFQTHGSWRWVVQMFRLPWKNGGIPFAGNTNYLISCLLVARNVVESWRVSFWFYQKLWHMARSLVTFGVLWMSTHLMVTRPPWRMYAIGDSS